MGPENVTDTGSVVKTLVCDAALKLAVGPGGTPVAPPPPQAIQNKIAEKVERIIKNKRIEFFISSSPDKFSPTYIVIGAKGKKVVS